MPTDATRQVIEQLEAKRQSQLAEAGKTERLINELLALINEPPRYRDETSERDAVRLVNVKRGQFYGKPLATAVREYLAARKEPATADEIMQGLEAGEFDFDALEWKKETRARSLAMSLAKNSVTFHRLPSGSFGLLEWYPNLPPKRAKGSSPAGEAGAETENGSKGAEG